MKLFQKPILFLLILVLVAWGFEKVSAQPFTYNFFTKDSIASFQLLSTNGKKSDFKTSNGLSCFIFLSPECPLCKNYAPLINDLKKKHDKVISFYLIVPGNSYSMGEIKSFGKEYLKNAVLYKDAMFDLSRYVQATVTPEVILLESESGKPVYRGALDNWAVSLGRQRNKATENYLLDAIESYLHHQPAPVAFKEPVGCLINDF